MPPPSKNADEPGPFDDARPALLRGTSPRDVLMRLCDGDPLEVGPRSEARLEERAYLLDPRLVMHRSLARVAYDSMRWRGDPPLAQFLERAIDKAMKELVEEEAETAFYGVGEDERGFAHYAFLSELLGLEPSLTRRACATFNALPRSERALFWSACVRGDHLVDLAIKFGSTIDEVHRRLTATLDLLSRSAGRRIEPRWKVDP